MTLPLDFSCDDELLLDVLSHVKIVCVFPKIKKIGKKF